MAPEIRKNNQYSKYSDVYLFGIFVYELMIERQVYNFSLEQIMYKVTNKRRPEFIKMIPSYYENLKYKKKL